MALFSWARPVFLFSPGPARASPPPLPPPPCQPNLLHAACRAPLPLVPGRRSPRGPRPPPYRTPLLLHLATRRAGVPTPSLLPSLLLHRSCRAPFPDFPHVMPFVHPSTPRRSTTPSLEFRCIIVAFLLYGESRHRAPPSLSH
jgi:hypothetical protein